MTTRASTSRAAMSLAVPVLLAAAIACGPPPQTADIAIPSAAVQLKSNLPSGFAKERLAKAQPDECFYGVGSDSNGPIPAGGCPAGVPAKVNQAYVWGLALSNGGLWFGTAPNVHCLVMGGYLGLRDPVTTDDYVCEFGQSKWVRGYVAANPGAPASTSDRVSAIGDWRAPQIFVYGTATKLLTNKVASLGPHAALLGGTIGLRSAGTLGNVVFLGGPGMQGGVNLFAFNTATGDFLGATTLPNYTNIRKWLVVDDVLYTGVAATDGNGYVLRWNGDPTATDLSTLFSFDVVGTVASDAAELAYHEGRIFVNTWPAGAETAGLWMSPAIPSGGFTSSDNALWTKVWGAEDYEPDPVTAVTYGGGALASYGGYLYWGTMHVPFVASEAHFEAYRSYYDATGGATNQQIAAGIAGTQRAIAIFRGTNFTTTGPQLQVAYGESALPAFDPATGWTLQPTKMTAPLYGSSGFGNYFNNYAWAMAVFQDRLFVGTMDWSYLANGLVQGYLASTGQAITLELPRGNFGADLWAFKSTRAGANPISQDGVGNYLNYGIRTTVSTADALYLGMANPMNLRTNPADKVPEGGWELVKVTKK